MYKYQLGTIVRLKHTGAIFWTIVAFPRIRGYIRSWKEREYIVTGFNAKKNRSMKRPIKECDILEVIYET